MFKTPSEKETWMQLNHLHYEDNGVICDNEGGVYNPYYFENNKYGDWHQIVGICIDRNEAMQKLRSLREKHPEHKWRCVRANEIESQSIIDYI